MFCTQCGSPIGDGDRFCASCGAAVNPRDADATAVAETTAEAVTETADETTAEAPVPETKETTADATVQGQGMGAADRPVEGTQPMPVPATQPIVPPAAPTQDLAADGPMPPDGWQGASTQPMPQAAVPPSASAAVPPVPPIPGQPQPGQGGQPKIPWYMTGPGRIAMGIVGAILVVSGLMRIAGAFSKPSTQSEPPATSTKVDDGDKGEDGKTFKENPKDDGKVAQPDGKTDGKTDGGTQGGDVIDGGDGKDIIIADPDDIVVSDPDDIVVRDPSGGKEDFGSWAPECTDKSGNPTAYAISELKGWQLETLCQEKGLRYDSHKKAWLGSGYKLTAYNVDRKELTDQEIAKIGRLGDHDDIVYQIEVSSYGAMKSVFADLVSKTVVCSDSEVTADDAVAIAYGPSMKKMLVYGYSREAVGSVTLQFFSQSFVEKGNFDRFSAYKDPVGGTFGKTVDEVFEHFTGRAPEH